MKLKEADDLLSKICIDCSIPSPDDRISFCFILPSLGIADGYKIGIDLTVLEGKLDCIKKYVEVHKKKITYSKISTQKVLIIYTPYT